MNEDASRTYEKDQADVYKFDISTHRLPGSSFTSSESPESTPSSPLVEPDSNTICKISDGVPSSLATSSSLIIHSSVPEPRKKKPYKELTLEEKVQLIRLAEDNAGLSQAAIAERYKIAKSNVCRILQRKSEYLTAYESAGFAGNRKRKLKAEDHKASNSSSVTLTTTANSSSHHHHGQPTVATLLDAHQLPHVTSTAQSSIPSNGLLVPAPLPFDGNETLRAHMYKQHQISRMFMCRCCNWAFPDKTSLHMHIQAREEGKSVSVPVIGKGMTTDGLAIETTSFAPLLQINNNNTTINNNNNTHHNNHNNNSTSAHVVPALAPGLSAAPPSTSLPFFSAVAPPNSLPTGSDELGRLRERIMINQLMNQHAFNNTFSWLNQLPKPIPTTRPLDLSQHTDADEDLVINVEKDIDSPKREDDDEKLNISISDSEEPKSERTKRTDSPCENACSSSTVGSSPSHTGSLPSPLNVFKKSRSSPSAFHHLNVDSRAFISVTSPHVSPSETNSSISPDGQDRPACYECALYKTKLTMADNKCRYLESRANTLQGETVRAQTQTAAAETAIRVLENDTRNLREHTESIQRKLLDCQEQALRFVQSDKTANQQAVVLFLNQLIQSTIIR